MGLVESTHDTLAGVGDARGDRSIVKVEEDEWGPIEEVDAHLDQERVPGTFPVEEEQVASPRVVEEECKGVVFFWSPLG